MATTASLTPPPASAPEPPGRRRVPAWLWLIIGVLTIGVLVFLAPVIALIALTVLITGIVALSKNTRTWLRFRSPKVAMAATALSAVVFLAAGLMTTVVYPSAAAAGREAQQVARPGTAASVAAEATPTDQAEPADDGATRDPFTGETATVADAGATGDQTALAVLATLEVKGRAPKTGYDRDQFGQRWLDVDRNGCDTRNDILARDLTGATFSGPCKVLTGVLADPYTGTTVDFVRGQGTSELVQIDHVVPLSDAWQKGAQQLTVDERASFANDPLNLLAVDGSANAKKRDGDAATWLPKNKSYRCAYVARQVSVKATYGLWVTQAEHDAMADVLNACPDEKAVTSAYAAAPVEAAPEPAPPAEPAPAPPQPVPAPAPVEVYYKNCDAARAAGAAPVHQGEPGYGKHLDRDGDGIGCDT
ncbi:DUF1524 domain-containing protein [Microbacterium sp. NPDC058389]|uniref:GmrSD restriction endonuclease domain-containing protein n=1 Tax=Microbacterium sp. NPDC058389 TaxID=3346475 RepID=UPI00364A486D